MGHVHSKKKREKKQHQDYISYKTAVTAQDDKHFVDSLKQVRLAKVNRVSLEIDRTSLNSMYDSHDSVSVMESRQSSLPLYGNNNTKELSPVKDLPRLNTLPVYYNNNSKESNYVKDLSKRSTLPINRNNNVKELNYVKESFSYEKLNVDDHPALTKLQNEQNRRLEKMEARMSQIRLHAMQEVERRKYAHLFKAKKKESPTRELLCKAKDKLNKEICDNTDSPEDSIFSDHSSPQIIELDKGEIIPVTNISELGDEQNEKAVEPNPNNYLQNLPALRAVNLNDPKSIFFLPFLLPIFIFWVVVRSISQSGMWQNTNSNTPHQKKRN